MTQTAEWHSKPIYREVLINGEWKRVDSVWVSLIDGRCYWTKDDEQGEAEDFRFIEEPLP